MVDESAHAIRQRLGVGPEAMVSLCGVRPGASDSDVAEAVRQAAEAATDFSWLSRGDAVFVKPVINSGLAYPATTSPTAVRTMVALLREKGAGRVVVSDMSGIEHVKLSPDRLKGSTRKLMESCGVIRAAVEAGAEVYFPEEDGWSAFFEDHPVTGSSWRSGIMMPRILTEMDHVVLLPRCSRHALAGATLGLKAAVGYWRTDSRLEYHHDARTFHTKTAEANTVPTLREKQRLTLTVADKVLATFGPDKGFVASPTTGIVFASESLVAHDMVSLAWLIETRKTIPGKYKRGFKDPYSVGLFVNVGNRWITSLLAGILKALTADSLKQNDLRTIWSDRILGRSYQLMGGVPQVELREGNVLVPSDMRQQLGNHVRVS